MTTSKKTQSALRATLKKEDSSLTQRLPDAMPTPALVPGPQEASEGPVQQIEVEKPRVATPVKGNGARAQEAVKKYAGTPEVIKANTRAAVASAKPRPRKSPPVVSAAKIVEPELKTEEKGVPKAESQAAPASAPGAVKKLGKAVKGKIESAKKMKPEKRVRDSFALATSEGKRLEALRDEVKAVGRRPTKSELVRAAISALTVRSGAEIMTLIEALPAISKGRSGKKKR